MEFLTLLVVLVAVASLCHADSHGGSTMEDAVTESMPTSERRRIRGLQTRSVCKIDGKGGVIKLSSVDSFPSDKTVELSLASIKEMGKRPADDMRNRHELSGGRSSFGSFSQQNFEFTELMNTTYPGTNLSVTSLEMSTSLQKKIMNEAMTIGSVILSVYIFNEAGTVIDGGETTDVMAGTLKFNIALSGFQFCNAANSHCDGKEGSALDVAISVKGQGGQKVMKAKRTKRPSNLYYSVGGKAALGVAKMVRADGKWKNMSEGFPMLATSGSESMLQLRFDRFESDILYDPIIYLELDDLVIEEDGERNDDVGDKDAAAAISSFGIIAILVASLVQAFF